MNKHVFLDTGPLSLLTNPRLPSITLDAIQWSVDLASTGHRLIVPAVADFELRRELERLASNRSLEAPDAFNMKTSDRYLAVTDSALKLAAKLWAQARNSGSLPADPKELNGDVLIAAQVLDYQATYGISVADIVIATFNVGHLSLFAPAEKWSGITP